MRIPIAIALMLVCAGPADARALAERLHEALETVAPIAGVSVGVKEDKQTWRIDFKPEADAGQRAAAQAALAAFDPSSPDTKEDSKASAKQAVQAAIDADDDKALMKALKDALKTGALQLR